MSEKTKVKVADIKPFAEFSTLASDEQDCDNKQLLKQCVVSLDDYITTSIEIRPREKGEIITTTGDSLTYLCLIRRLQDSLGNFQKEEFFPAHQDISAELNSHIRIVTFHGCHSKESGFFLYPQKRNTGAFKNSWNASLEQALKTPPGVYFSLDANSQLQTYEVTLQEDPAVSPPQFDDFESALYDALSANIITSIEHPLVQELLQQ